MLFRPRIWIKSVLDIDEEFLKKNNIKALVLDLDNTLSMHGNPLPEKGIPEWLDYMRSINMPMRVVSNNTNKRVKPLADKLGLPFTANGAKPFTFGITRARKAMNADKKTTAVIGDQIFTDTMAGNLSGCISVLVEPFHMETSASFKFKRKIEAMVFPRNKMTFADYNRKTEQKFEKRG